MQKKRFRVIKDNDSIKPLRPKATNVKIPSVDSLLKSSVPNSVKKSNTPSPPKKQRKKTSEDKIKKSKPISGTVFDSDNVRLNLVGPNRKLNFMDGTREQQVEKSHQLGRLTMIEEEDDSLKLEDFDQPPESTSTPILCSSHRSYGHEQNASPYMVGTPYQASPIFYSYNAYPYIGYNHPILPNDSPLQNKVHQEQQRIPFQYASYVTSQIPARLQRPLQPYLQMNYPTSMGSNAGRLGISDPLLYPVENVTYQHVSAPDYPALLPRVQLFNNINTSNSSSYKSSGGDATYQGSCRGAETDTDS